MMRRAVASAAARLPSVPPAWLAGGALAAAMAWSGDERLLPLAIIIAGGVPHGALDGEVARGLLRPRFGAWWFIIFAIPYLSLSAGVLLAWQVAPASTLAAFLAASVWHFGTEDAGPGRPWETLVRGGLPVAVPVLAHPVAAWAVFATAAGLPLGEPPPWLWAASLGWLAAAAVWAAMGRQLPALLATAFIVLPPLPAFAVYFVCLHSPAHMAGLIRNPRRAPRVHDVRSAVLRSLPITLLTVAFGVALWPFYSGAAPGRLLALTLQGLAALTLPHMLLDAWLTRRERLAGEVAALGQETNPSC